VNPNRAAPIWNGAAGLVTSGTEQALTSPQPAVASPTGEDEDLGGVRMRLLTEARHLDVELSELKTAPERHALMQEEAVR